MPRFTDESITTARLVSFSDGVFAIAVTLLVFNIKVPALYPTEVHERLPGVIFAMMPIFVTYLLTFLVIAIYWIFHHRMLNLVVRIDKPFLWMNIYFLLFISFIPFPAALLGTYTSETFSFIFYIGSMIAVSCLAMLMLGYSSGKSGLIKDGVPRAFIRYLFFRQFTTVFVFITSIPVVIFEPSWAKYYLFLIFPIHQLTKKQFRKYAGEQPDGSFFNNNKT
jgi:uncharacterized membrane protein